LSSKTTDRTLALAGAFQSAALVQQLARTGEVSANNFKCSIDSIFALDPENVTSVYGGTENVSLGINALHRILTLNQTRQYADTIRYAIGLFHIEKNLSKNEEILSILRSRLKNMSTQRDHFDSTVHNNIIGKLADLYVDTIGTFKYRIQVKGNPEYLQQPDIANKVRAVFLSGVRSIMLWRQLGGSRLNLILGKKALIRDLEVLGKPISHS